MGTSTVGVGGRGHRRVRRIEFQDHDGVVPKDFNALVALPGVGPKIANLVRAVSFGEVVGCGLIVDGPAMPTAAVSSISVLS